MGDTVRSEIIDGMAVITTDKLPVNALSSVVRKRLWLALDAANEVDDVDAVVLACAGKTFFTGANITEFGPPPEDPLLPEIVDMIEDLGKAAEEVVSRTLFAMINEGAKILCEGIASRSSDIDLVYCNRYGFPSYRGGPTVYGEQMGLHKVLDSIRQFQDKFGDRWWKLTPVLEELVATGRNRFE